MLLLFDGGVEAHGVQGHATRKAHGNAVARFADLGKGRQAEEEKRKEKQKPEVAEEMLHKGLSEEVRKAVS